MFSDWSTASWPYTAHSYINPIIHILLHSITETM